MKGCKGEYLIIVHVLGLALISFSSAQTSTLRWSCPLITANDLGSTTEFSTNGLVARAIVPLGEALSSLPVRIRNFTIVCDASGDRINTSSYVSVVVELQCNSQSSNPTLIDCDGNTPIIRQYQFQCIEQNGQPVWDTTVSGSNQFVQTLNPTATLSTPLANQCRRCIDNQQSFRADPTTHCDPCPSQCDQGQGRCYLGSFTDECCNFYLQGNCVTDCPSNLVNDSNFNCVIPYTVCPVLTIVDGSVRYSTENREIGSVAIHSCNFGYRLLPEGGDTRYCNITGWTGQNVTCELIQCPQLTIANGQVTVNPQRELLNSRATFTCNPGFVLRGDGTRICQADGTWSGTEPECVTSGQNNNFCNACNCQFNNIQVLMKLIRAEITAIQTNEQNLSGSVSGVTYTRWGKLSCPTATGAQLVYAGRVGGTSHRTQGGAAGKICMPEDPDYTNETAGLPSSIEHGRVFGSEYQFDTGPDSLRDVHQHNVPCAVCYVPTRATTIMVPAKTVCPSSWTREYSGYLTSEGESEENYRSSYNCIDADPDVARIPSSEPMANTNGTQFYFVQSTCNGFDCPPYQENRILSCVVCTK